MPPPPRDQRPIFFKASGPSPKESPFPTLILLHGAGGTHLDWPTTVRYFEGVSVIAPDLPGHGRSDGPGCTTIDGYAAQLIRLIDGFEVDRIIVAGHSMGGAIAQQIGLENPAWLTGLILIGTGPVMKVSPQILEQIHGNMAAVADFVTKYAWFKNANFIMKGVGRRRVMENDPDVLYGDYAACNGFDIRGRLDQIRVPTLVVGGEADRFMPLKFSHMLADGIPHAELVVISQAGHMVQLEKENEVRDQLERFVKQA